MNITSLIIVRTGQYEGNAEANNPLNDTGKAGAIELAITIAEVVAGQKKVTILHAPLLQTQQTACFIEEALHKAKVPYTISPEHYLSGYNQKWLSKKLASSEGVVIVVVRDIRYTEHFVAEVLKVPNPQSIFYAQALCIDLTKKTSEVIPS